jgi:heme A synthase
MTVAAFGLVLFQAALGGLTVEKGLEEELVAAHLGVAMLQIRLLLLIAFLLRAQPTPGSDVASIRSGSAAAPPAVRLLSVLTGLAVLGTIVAGGYMSANELHGTGEHARAVHMACGKDFPSCQGEFLPFGRTRDLDIHLTHRAFMYLASALMLLLFVTVLRHERRRAGDGGSDITWAASGAFGIFLAQVLLGALNVWLGEHPWLVILHLTTGTLLWCSLVYLSLLVLRGREQVAPAPREATIEAVPA